MFERCFGAVGTRKRFVWFVWALTSLGDMLLCIFAGLTATALEKLLAEIHKSNSEDTTATRMFSLLQANCVASIIFVMVHFITSLAFLMGRWFTSAPPGMLYGILCTQTACNMCLLLAMASPLVAYDIEMSDLVDAGLKANGLDLWAEEKLSLYRIAFALMFSVAGANAMFLGALVMAKSVFGSAPAQPEEQRGGFWSRRRRDEEAPPPPPPAAEKREGFFGRFGRGSDQAPAAAPAPAHRAASPEDNMRPNPLFRFGRGDDDAPPLPPPPPAPRYQAPEPPQRPAFASAFAGGRFASGGDSNPFGDAGGASDNPFASAASSVAWGAATSPGAASRGAALYEMSSRR